jgi:membrane protein implicated in regulation of membrane protease activity
MVLAALILGALAAYYFGLRAGGAVAVATFVLCLVALFVPRLALPIYGVVAAGMFAIWQIGARRKRPTAAVFAVSLVQHYAKRTWSRLRGDDDNDNRNNKRN